MTYSSQYFGVNATDIYPLHNWETSCLLKEDQEKFWAFRQVLFDFFYGLKGGYAKNYLPTPGFFLSEETVDTCLEVLDMEWEKERTGRGLGIFNDKIEFSKLLSPLQKLALMERLLKIAPEWEANAKIKKEKNKNIGTQPLYWDDDC